LGTKRHPAARSRTLCAIRDDEFDNETGIYFYRNRYFDPVAGRFLSEDPLRFLSGSDFYSYVHNNPVRFLDPYGLQEKKKKEKDPDTTGDWIPGVHWIKCKIWGYYCLQVVFQKKQEELAHPSPYSDDDLSRGTGDEGKRQIEICVAGDDNCKKYLKNCGDDILGGLKDGMFPH
jgi:RHS repeat-associated protein